MAKTMPPEFYSLLEDIQAIDFVLVELTLYLDTHPDDYEAIQQFNYYAMQSKSLKKEYEKHFGPLRQYGASYSGYPWSWNDTPWPWQV